MNEATCLYEVWHGCVKGQGLSNVLELLQLYFRENLEEKAKSYKYLLRLKDKQCTIPSFWVCLQAWITETWLHCILSVSSVSSKLGNLFFILFLWLTDMGTLCIIKEWMFMQSNPVKIMSQGDYSLAEEDSEERALLPRALSFLPASSYLSFISALLQEVYNFWQLQTYFTKDSREKWQQEKMCRRSSS